jgi:hypothetical protein
MLNVEQSNLLYTVTEGELFSFKGCLVSTYNMLGLHG